MDDERDRQIEVSINRFATSKIPRDAPNSVWAKFHKHWECQTMGARELAIQVYKGYSFAPCFNGRKIKADFDHAWHLALDFDCADERAKIETLLKDDIVNFFASFLYYTPSSKPPAYKARVVFVLDGKVSTVDEYEAIQAAFAWRFPDSDQSTTDAARFFYGSYHCELFGAWSVLPLNVAQSIVEDYRRANPPREPEAKPYNPGTTDEREVAAALKLIPQRMDYAEWLSVLMAVHSSFPNQVGINLCEAWSPGYDGEIEDKFASFDRSKKNGITVRTLFKMAQENGYKKNGGYKRGPGRSSNYDLRSAL
jgi:hypothetical protein